jgi:hypothetical protein
MNNLFKLSDGSVDEVSGKFEMGGGVVPPIPEKTVVLAMCDAANFYQHENNPIVISLKWTVIAGEYKGRIVFQKLNINDSDTQKADRSKRMLMAIDSNCGGKLMKLESEITDADLALSLPKNKMHLKLGVWDMNGKKGNWVSAVAPAVASAAATAVKYNDDVPF